MFDAISILACIVVNDVSPWVHNPWLSSCLTTIGKEDNNTKFLTKKVSPCKIRCSIMSKTNHFYPRGYKTCMSKTDQTRLVS
jgi:hypothetical protein